jgi:hypothetical protein
LPGRISDPAGGAPVGPVPGRWWHLPSAARDRRFLGAL